MPIIRSELRLQIEGGQTPPLVKRSELKVDSCELFTLSVDAVPPLKPVKSPAGNAKQEKRWKKAIYTPSLANVQFVAIYDGGQGSGLRVKVGKSKMAPLTQPLIFQDRVAAGFGSKPVITLENDSAFPKSAIMLVGSNLPKDDRKIVLVKKAMPRKKISRKKAKTKKS